VGRPSAIRIEDPGTNTLSSCAACTDSGPSRAVAADAINDGPGRHDWSAVSSRFAAPTLSTTSPGAPMRMTALVRRLTPLDAPATPQIPSMERSLLIVVIDGTAFGFATGCAPPRVCRYPSPPSSTIRASHRRALWPQAPMACVRARLAGEPRWRTDRPKGPAWLRSPACGPRARVRTPASSGTPATPR